MKNPIKRQWNTILISFLLVSIAQSIDQACTLNNSSNSCPYNSTCASNNYCQCDSGFIGMCNVSAVLLGQTFVEVSLEKNEDTFLAIEPQQLEKYIEFSFQICQPKSSLTLSFAIWQEKGTISSFSRSNSFGQSYIYTLSKKCNKLQTTYLYFLQQPNGRPEKLILGIINQGDPVDITIKVTQSVLLGINFYFYVIISLFVFLFCSILATVVMVIIRRRRNVRRERLANPNNDLTYFEKFLPSVKGATMEENDRTICSICLMQMQGGEMLRKTPCKHTFHTTCLDSWCIKHLTCPVCRLELSERRLIEFHNKQSAEIQIPDITEERESTNEVPRNAVGNYYHLREAIL